ncbi:uncharacterized protein LOC106088633 [Stomoxys calcitrans]|uniref:Aminotransferase class I/classII large domain-containing protein n=1 Tax=Stomoxys calcitrans TaxID=35570 RepID=A0A1I8P6A0_STOCA|nr:uncharacterized protein LOC106088633 [Stomoxys calcitrans]
MSLINEEQKLTNLFDGTEWNLYDSKILDLSAGAPDPDLLQHCVDIFRQATEHSLHPDKKSNSSLLFQYGPKSGLYEVRLQIAKYFTHMYGSEVKCEDLFITCGATQGLNVILSTLVDLNGYIFVDEITYMSALDVIRQFSSMHIIPIKLSEDGTDLEDLEKHLKEYVYKAQKKQFWGMYYTIPIFHNPTGVLFSPTTCKGLIKLARKYDILITCDDVYNILNYNDENCTKRLLSYDNKRDKDYRGHVVSNGSFSKIISPGIRLGWFEVPRRIKDILECSGIIDSAGCLNNYTSGIVASLFELGLAQTHINRMYETYKERMLATLSTLKKELPVGCKMSHPEGGQFIWITLEKGCSASEFLKVCMEEERIFFLIGTVFTVIPERASNCFRLSIAFYNTDKLEEAVKRMCRCLRKYLKNTKNEIVLNRGGTKIG